MPPVIHRRQRAILDYITLFIQKNGYAPTLREIADGVGLSSLATVHEHISKLEEKGILKRKGKASREIKLIHKKYASWKGAVDLPVLGYITAGEPIKTYSTPGVTIQVAPNLISGKKRAFIFQIKGDSMVEEGILNGDYLVIEEDPEVNNGDVIIALLENGIVTVKRFFKEATRIRLEPASSKMAPLFVVNITIQGKVKALIRKFV